MKATWNGHVIAQSDDIINVEGNAYFPSASLDQSVVRPSTHTSVCPWKGQAHYYSLEIGGKRNENAIWYYPEPKAAASSISGRVAFWNGVQVSA